jgi:hypothetical protein
MSEEDKTIYKEITKKVMDNKRDELTYEQLIWLKENPNIKKLVHKMAAKVEIMSYFKESKDTIEEILFILDLSDRFIR